MERLIDNKTIGAHEVRAAMEVERIFLFVAGGLLSRTMSYSERTDPSRSDDVPAWFLSAYRKRYRPWADKPGPGVDVCLSVLVDGQSGREVDRRYGWRNGTAVTVLVRALRDYAVRAGWPDPVTLKLWVDEVEQAA